MRADVVFGGQYGSEGKGKVVGWMAMHGNYDAAICNFSSQAGHTWVGDDGKSVMVRQTPMAVVSDRIPELMIGPASIIDPEVLLGEIDSFGLIPKRLFIDEHAVIIQDRHKHKEAQTAKRIASTMKGNGAAAAEKALRCKELVLARDYLPLKSFVTNVRDKVHLLIRTPSRVLVEASQGYGLDIDHGFYPYTTSRGCTPQAELARCGIPIHCVGDIVGCYRPYPIRVGNVVEDGKQKGWSGPIYPDQEEITWQDVKDRSGAPIDMTELTTVTRRVRRVFTFSTKQMLESMSVCGVTVLYLNFANHIDYACYGAERLEDLTTPVWQWVERNIEPVIDLIPWSDKVRIWYGTGEMDRHHVMNPTDQWWRMQGLLGK